MAKTTYLLGAGASAGSLPTVEKFVPTLEDLILKVNDAGTNYAKEFPKDKKQIQKIQQTLQDLSFLYEGCVEHRSVDTFLKKLFLTAGIKEDKSKYRIAKCSIILFFELYRFFYNSIDKRYDAFLATVLKREGDNLILPPEINILSWNYDYEFERAYMKYTHQRNNIDEVYQDLNIIHKNSQERRSIANNFGIIKINGTAGFFHNNKVILGLGHCNLAHKIDASYNINVTNNINDVMLLINNYQKFSRELTEEYQPAISFAWEDGDGMDRIKKEIIEALSNTRKLIVIGYSFPYFNREIDAFIARSCEMGPSIYIQSPDALSLIDSIEELDNTIEKDFIYPKTNTDQFYMSF